MLDPSGATCGVTHNLCNALADLSCEVHWFTAPSCARAVARCRTREYRMHVAFYRRTQSRSYAGSTHRPVTLLWRLARLAGHLWMMARIVVIARRFDIVHVQWLPVPLLDILWLWWLTKRTAVVYTVHNRLPHDIRWKRLYSALYRVLYRLPRALFVHTSHTARGLVGEFGVPPERIVEIRHGSLDHLLDIPHVQAGHAKPNGSTPLVALIGQIRHDKGLDVLLRATHRLLPELPNIRILVAGRPRVDMAPYFELVRRLDLSNVVEFRLGYLNEEELPALFRSATVVVLPYRSIDQSGVAVAACTFGKAIVASRCGGLEELVGEAENGLLVPVDDPERLADAIRELVLDRPQRARLELNSRRYAAGALSWEPIAAKTLETYRAVTRGSAPASLARSSAR